jgi:putative redox protein
VVMDRPEAKGGTNKGMMGGEAVLNGLGGCFMSNLLAAAKARTIELQDARADIEGDMADAPSRFTAIRISVSARCNPPEELSKLVTIAERGCIAANTLRAAVDLSIKIV